jgi:hypothetical protein
MKHKYFYLALTLLLPALVYAQGPVLQPSIGLSALPSDSDSICPIPVYTGSFYTSGLAVGATIPDFTLYKLNGDSVNMQTELQDGLPVLLVSGSYTCPVFRQRVADLNNMMSTYLGQLKAFVVYAVEAHPIVDPSPYSGNVWVTTQNQNDGVLYRQPVTYGQRKAMVDTMLMNITINADVLIDGPCNNWWNTFGPAPNNAYLIDTNGVIFAKHGWFHKLPDNMYCDIDSLLGTNSGNCSTVPNNGLFSFSLDADSTVMGYPGDVITVYSTLTNLSSLASVTIDIIKIQNNIPVTWQSALCTDICLAPSVDTTQFTIPPSGTQSFSMHFYTDSTPNSGVVQVGFRNAYNNNNRLKQNFYGYTVWDLGLSESARFEGMKIYPNPASDLVRVDMPVTQNAKCVITDIAGRVLKTFPAQDWSGGRTIAVNDLDQGAYFIIFTSGSGRIAKRFIIAR